MLKKILSIALLMVALCGCKKSPIDETIPVASVSLNQDEAEMLVGETLQLQAQISPSNATDKTMMWGSTKQSVATVSDEGLVTAVGQGTSKITVTASGKTASCVVTVTKSDTPVNPVHVESVSLDKETAAMEIGETLALTATVLPANADDKSVAWKSTNPEIAEVDQNGNVTAVNSGTVTITATTTDGGKVAGCELTVTEPFIPVESISFVHDELIAFIDDPYTPDVTVLPENATDKTVTWTSSDPGILSVTAEGMVCAHATGIVELTARAGDKEATCTIYCVHNPDDVDDEYDGEENGRKWVDLGLPSGIKWATSNVGAENSAQVGSLYEWGETFAREDENDPPYTLKNQSTGKFIKYVTSSIYGDIDNLTILEPQDDAARQWGGDWRMPTEVDVLELMDYTTYEFMQQNGVWGAKLTSINNGHSIFLPADYNDATNYHAGSYYSSSLSKGVDQCATGLIFNSRGIFKGSISRESMCPVRAVFGTSDYIPVETLETDYSNIELEVGATRTLNLRILPENATNKTVNWSSDDESVATVDDNGTVTACKIGNTLIRARVGSKSYNFYISVIPVLESFKINPSDVTLKIGESVTITVETIPNNIFDYYRYRGYSCRGGILDLEVINDDNSPTFRITAKAAGEASFEYYIYSTDKNLTATCNITVPYVEDPYDGETDGHLWVDLGLPSGIRWATCNVGAYYSTQRGPSFTWGENENDPAKANWGGRWHLPTKADVVELRENTTQEFMTLDDMPGVKLTSKINGHSIFMATESNAHSGMYLTSLRDGESVAGIFFNANDFNVVYTDLEDKHLVRAVIGNTPYIPVESVDFGYSHDFLNVGDVKLLSVDIYPADATNKKITWSSSDESVAVVDSHGKLTCVGAGSTLIYAKVDGKQDYVILRVSQRVSISLDPSSLTLGVGESATVTVKLDPEIVLDTFGLSNWMPSVFSVERVGSDYPITYKVTGLAEGSGSFAFSATGTSASCYVTVVGN